VVVAVVIVGVAFVATQLIGGAGAIAAPGVVTPASIPSSDRTLGSPTAPVTIDLYGDFRCSACYQFTVGGTEKDVVDGYIATGKAKLVWHDRLIIDELTNGTASRDAANASRCAADQGKFWVMHDWLYANQSPTEDASAFTKSRLADIGRAAGLDMSRFQPCLDQGTHDSEVTAENANAPKQVTGTPTVYVNGQYVGTAGSWPVFSQIKTAIDAALASPQATSPSVSAAP
jgi:protein-disulfide isomerase